MKPTASQGFVHEIGSDVSGTDDRAVYPGCIRHEVFLSANGHAHLEAVTFNATVPRPPTVALTCAPGFSATIGPNAPVISRSPALSGSSRARRVRASHAAAANGWPRQAAPTPVETTRPSISMTMPQLHRSRPDAA